MHDECHSNDCLGLINNFNAVLIILDYKYIFKSLPNNIRLLLISPTGTGLRVVHFHNMTNALIWRQREINYITHNSPRGHRRSPSARGVFRI